MSRLSVELFATKNDWLPGLEKVERELQPQFVAMGPSQSPHVPVLASLRQEEQLGVSSFGNAPLERSYWICRRDTKVSVREVPQKKQPAIYSTDLGDRPVAVVIRLGGVFKENCLIAGQLGAGSEDEEVQSFFRALSSRLLEGFTKVGAYMVGPEARTLLDSGWRLTYAFGAPPLYDLNRE